MDFVVELLSGVRRRKKRKERNKRDANFTRFHRYSYDFERLRLSSSQVDAIGCPTNIVPNRIEMEWKTNREFHFHSKRNYAHAHSLQCGMCQTWPTKKGKSKKWCAHMYSNLSHQYSTDPYGGQHHVRFIHTHICSSTHRQPSSPQNTFWQSTSKLGCA